MELKRAAPTFPELVSQALIGDRFRAAATPGEPARDWIVARVFRGQRQPDGGYAGRGVWAVPADDDGKPTGPMVFFEE